MDTTQVRTAGDGTMILVLSVVALAAITPLRFRIITPSDPAELRLSREMR